MRTAGEVFVFYGDAWWANPTLLHKMVATQKSRKSANKVIGIWKVKSLK